MRTGVCLHLRVSLIQLGFYRKSTGHQARKPELESSFYYCWLCGLRLLLPVFSTMKWGEDASCPLALWGELRGSSLRKDKEVLCELESPWRKGEVIRILAPCLTSRLDF